jgi:hypothetical protein
MKRSAAKRSRRHKPLTFYVDECLGRFVAEALSAGGFDVRPYYDYFAGMQDVDWLPQVGVDRWILLTKDKNIRRRQLEVDAILNSGVRAFVVTAVGLHREDLAKLMLRVMPKNSPYLPTARPVHLQHHGERGRITSFEPQITQASVQG